VSAEPSLAFWINALLVLAVGVTVAVALAALLARWPATAVGRRTVWQAATVALAGLLVSEVTGVAGVAASWLSRRPAPPPEAPTPARVALRLAGTAPVAPAVAGAAEAGTRDEPPGDVVPDAGSPTVLPAPVWWPGAVWLAGALAVAARVGVARVLLVAFRRRHRPAADEALLERVGAVAGRVGMRRRVVVLEADGLVGPVAFGVWRPTVALPARFAKTFTPAQQEVILAHELTHLAAGDPGWHLLAELVTAAVWWQPLAWWARQQLRAAGEMAADESSLLVADGPAVLARCLVEMGGALARTRSAGWLRMAGSGFRSGLGRRVERLVHLDGRAWRPPGRARALAVLALVPAALLAAAVLSTAWARAPALSEGDEPMRYPWKRSLAGLVLVAALGPNTGPGLAGDPPAAPPANDPNGANPAGAASAPDGKSPAAADPAAPEAGQRQKLEADQRALAEAEAKLRAQRDALRRAADDPRGDAADRQKIEDQLRGLQKQMGDLSAKKAALEEQLRALEEKKEDAAIHIKVFRLAHQDPEEMRGVIDALLLNRQGAPPGAGGGGAGMMGPMGAMGGGGRAGRGARGMRAGAGGAMRPPAGGGNPFMMGGMGRPETSWRLAVDQRSRSLIVRGTAQDIQTVADLVALLDVPEGKSTAGVKGFRVFHLRYANAQDVAGILGALDIGAAVVPAPGARAVVVSGPEAALKEVAEVIDAVDVEGKPGPTPAEGGKGRP
jgi:beta-lactamase regulating signal transducer with metallopeptidase domain